MNTPKLQPKPNPTNLDLLELALQVHKESKEFLEVGKQFCEWIKSKINIKLLQNEN